MRDRQQPGPDGLAAPEQDVDVDRTGRPARSGQVPSQMGFDRLDRAVPVVGDGAGDAATCHQVEERPVPARRRAGGEEGRGLDDRRDCYVARPGPLEGTKRCFEVGEPVALIRPEAEVHFHA